MELGDLCSRDGDFKAEVALVVVTGLPWQEARQADEEGPAA